MRDEVIYFVDIIQSDDKDEYGDPVEKKEISDAVFAEIKSISQTEFYQAQTSDYKPEIKFKITDYMDYQGQKYLIHNEIKYKVLRTFRTDSNELEITCYGGVRDVIATVSDKN